MRCAVCDRSVATVGVLCEDCRDELASPPGLLPDQIVEAGFEPAGVALVDVWGRPHALDAHNTIGRHLETPGVGIFDGSISRRHAELGRGDGGWVLHDLGSSNGTWVDDQPVVGTAPVRHGARIGIGQVSFYFVEGAEQLPEIHVDPDGISTIRPAERVAALPVPVDLTEERPPELADMLDDREDTDVGMPEMELRVVEPTGGGGGLLEIAGAQVQLTATQLELVQLLIRRMADEAHQPGQVRGFVRSSELIGALSWDTREPTENHVKQLVRRVRRTLVRAGVGDLVESRHRFGYRLRVVPRTPS